MKDLFGFYLNPPNNGDVESGAVPFRDLRPDVERTECMLYLIDYMMDNAGIFEMIIITERNRRLTEQHVRLFYTMM